MNEIEKLEKEISKKRIEDETLEAIALKQNIKRKNLRVSIEWTCEDSPLGWCVMDYGDGFPCCVFCGDPDERK